MLSSATVKIAVANKTLVKTNFSSVTFCFDKTTKLSDLKMSIRFDIILITIAGRFFPLAQVPFESFCSLLDVQYLRKTNYQLTNKKEVLYSTVHCIIMLQAAKC